MATLHFTAAIQIIGVNPYVLVSAKQAAELQTGWRKPMPVTVQVNGQPKPAWHINTMPVGDGSFYLYLAGEVRKASKTKVGDTVTVDVAFDPDYMPGPDAMPAYLQAALDDDPVAQAAWNALVPSRQKEIVRYLNGLKSDEAKQRNLAKVLQVLGGESARFMGRTWKDGK